MNGQLEDTANNDSIILKTVLKNQPNYINQYSIIERFQTRIHFDYVFLQLEEMNDQTSSLYLTFEAFFGPTINVVKH